MRLAAIATTIFLAMAATIALSLIGLARIPWGPANYPCSLASKYILDVKSWTAEAMPSRKITTTVTVGINDLWSFGIFQREKVVKLSGLVFLGIKGFSIGSPSEPIGVGDTYVYNQILYGYNDDPLVTRPKGSIRGFRLPDKLDPHQWPAVDCQPSRRTPVTKSLSKGI